MVPQKRFASKSTLYKYITAAAIMVCVSLGVRLSAAAETLGVLTGDRVNVRDSGSFTDSNVLYRVDRQTKVEIIGLTDDYYHVRVLDSLSGEETDEYIAAEYIRIIQTTGITLEDENPLYAEPDGNGGIITVFGPYETLVLTAVRDEFYCTEYRGETAYISKDCVSIPAYAKLPQQSYRGSGQNALADEIIEFALTYLDTPYCYGSMDPKRGFDCSGFVSFVMQNFGIKLNRSSYDMALNGEYVEKEDLLPGDLVFFYTGSTSQISHVGIYIGDNQFVHAASGSQYRVIISGLEDAYYLKRYVKATRVL